MKIEIPEPEQVATKIPAFIDALVYGFSGTGKTEFAATFEPPILFLDTDDGFMSVVASPRISQQAKAEIYRVPVVDQSPDPHVKQPIGFITVKTIMEQIATTGEYSNLQPKTIVLDSLTTLSEMCMSYVLNAAGKPPKGQPSLPDWGRQMREITDIIHWGVAANCHFICIAHQQFTKDEHTGRLWCLPLVTGKLAYNLASYFDEVYYAQTKPSGSGVKYTLATKPNGLIVAKSRLDLPTEVDTHFDNVNSVLQRLKTSAKQAAAANAQKGGGGQQAAMSHFGLSTNADPSSNPKP